MGVSGNVNVTKNCGWLFYERFEKVHSKIIFASNSTQIYRRSIRNCPYKSHYVHPPQNPFQKTQAQYQIVLGAPQSIPYLFKVKVHAKHERKYGRPEDWALLLIQELREDRVQNSGGWGGVEIARQMVVAVLFL